jgi:hypothetical protein
MKPTLRAVLALLLFSLVGGVLTGCRITTAAAAEPPPEASVRPGINKDSLNPKKLESGLAKRGIEV